MSIAVIFHFFVSATLSVFLVNGSWSQDNLSAPYFAPCCTENTSIIEIDQSLHCFECILQYGSEKKFQLQHDINIAHSHNQTSFFFQKELRQFLFI